MSLESLPVLLQQIILSLLVLLLVGVTLGIGYLTVSDWRDRRRRQQSSSPRKTSLSNRPPTKR